MDIDHVTFKDLVDLDELQLLFEQFSTATGYTTCVVDHATNEVLIGTAWRTICVNFHRACPQSKEVCEPFRRDLASGLDHAGEVCIQHCQNGLVDGCTPIIIAGKHFADLIIGQVLFAPPDIERFRLQSRQYGFDEQAYLASLAEVPVVSEESFSAMLHYVAHMASLIAQTGFANFTARRESTGKEALLQSIFSSAPVGIGFVVNRVFQWTNNRMTEITGYSSAELAGRSSRILYPSEEEFERVGQEKYRQIKDSGTGSVDTRFKRKDGSIINIHLSSTPIDPQDLTAGVTFTALDITERAQAAAAIEDNKERLQLALEGADLGMWDWDIQSDAMYYSPYYFSMLGYSPEELPHTPATWENLLHPEDKARALQHLQSCLGTKPAKWSMEFRLRAKNGEYIWILGRGKVVEFGSDGSPLRAAGTHLDITAAKLAEKALLVSEERFRELFNNMGTAVAIYGVVADGNDFTIRDMNKAALVSSHFEHYQVVGKSVMEVFPGVEDMGLLEVFQRVWKTGIPEYFPCSSYQDDRIALWVENYVCKIPSGEIVAIYDDITDRKKAEDELLRSKKEWAATFDVMADIITIQDKDMRIVRANKAAYTFLQAHSGELKGKNCYEAFTGLSVPCPGCPLVDTLQDVGKHSAIIEHKNLGKIFQVSSAAILTDNGDLQYLVHVARDITEQKKMEEDLFQAHKLEAIGTLAGGIAHDFNNILTAIMGYAELVQYDLPETGTTRNNIDQILMAGKRAADLVQQILTFSRKAESRRQPLQAHLIIKEALKMLRALLPTTLAIEEHIDPECGSILADPTNIHQIMVNICTNAFHAMENEKGTLTVNLCRQEIAKEDISESNVSPGPFIVLSVRDTGRGMNKEVMARIFEPYFTTKEMDKGSGLGLAVIHGIVKAHNGFIRVESELGQGTTFHVCIPAMAETHASTAPAYTDNKNLPRGTERILVVDDESSIVSLNTSILELLGYQVTATTDSEEALDILRAHAKDFDLVITDQTMPKLSGVELAQEILKIKTDMPIILCSGYSSIITEDSALVLGIKKFVMKPVDITELSRIVRQVLDEN